MQQKMSCFVLWMWSLVVFVAKGDDLDIPSSWLPSNRQNGQEVVAVVKLIVNTGMAFKEQLSGMEKYQSKGTLLKYDQGNENYSDTSLWVYLLTTNTLPSNAVLRVEGKLTVSDKQLKGGQFPARIDVNHWKTVIALRKESRSNE